MMQSLNRSETLAGDILHSMVLADTQNDTNIIYKEKGITRGMYNVNQTKHKLINKPTSQTSSIVDASSLLLEAEMLLQQSPIPHPMNNNNNTNSHDVYKGSVNLKRGFPTHKQEQKQEKQSGALKYTDYHHKSMQSDGNTPYIALMTSTGDPTTRTSVVYTQENTPRMSTFSSKDHSIDAEAVRDAILSIKEARRLRRTQLLSYNNKGTSSSSLDASLSFIQRLAIPRSIHLETVESLNEAIQLLQKERKWINMRCTILYDRLQQLYRYRATVMNRLKEVHGEQHPVNIESGTLIPHQ